jgi:predicted nucleotidyltransferase
MNRQDVCTLLQAQLSDLLAIYAFGSRVSGDAGPNSDLDLAVLVAGYADPLLLWDLSGELADLTGCPVDLLDFRAASTVMQYQILTTGERWWAPDSRADIYEAAILSEKTELDTARAGLLADIQQRGSIYGR